MRRRQLAGASGAALLVGLAGPAQAANVSPDAELVQVCRSFAETELASWYRYVVTAEADADAADALPWPDQQDVRRWIEAAPATTLDGLRAKALAYSAWDRDAFDDPEDDRDGRTPLLASLLRDLVRPEQDAIVARLAAEHGPLPDTYSVNGMWLGEVEGAAPEPPARVSILGPIGSLHTMDLHGRGADGDLYLWSEAQQVEAITRFPITGGWIKGGHYLVEDAGEPVTVHCGNLADGRMSVQFMCSRRHAYMTAREAERLLCGRVVPDPKAEAEILGLLTGLNDSLIARQTAPGRKRGAA